MSLVFYDAAYPPADPPGVDGVCFYIGGDTFHVWTKAEINAQKAVYRLPIFVRSNPPGPNGAAADSLAAINQLKKIGAPTGTLVAWDLESSIEIAYIEEVYEDLRASGYKLIVYGSQSTVMANKNPDGLYWGADWTDVEHLHSGDAITQYVSFSGFDLSEAGTNLPFWSTKSPTPKPTPTPSNWQEKTMNSLPTVKSGMSDSTLQHWYIHRVQAILNGVWHNHLVTDGVFGAETESAVKSMQKAMGLTQDGIVGPATWSVLIGG